MRIASRATAGRYFKWLAVAMVMSSYDLKAVRISACNFPRMTGSRSR